MSREDDFSTTRVRGSAFEATSNSRQVTRLLSLEARGAGLAHVINIIESDIPAV